MPYSDNINNPVIIVNRVNHPVVTHANAPQKSFAVQFATARGARLFRQRFNFRKDAIDNSRIQCFQFFSGGARESDTVISH